MYFNPTAVFKIDSVYKQGKIIIFRYMLKSVNTSMQKTDNVTCSAMMMIDFLRCK